MNLHQFYNCSRLLRLGLISFALLLLNGYSVLYAQSSPFTIRNSKSVGIIGGTGLAFTSNGRNLFHEGMNVTFGVTYRQKQNRISGEYAWTINNFYKHLGEQVGLEQMSFIVSYNRYLLETTTKHGLILSPFVGVSASLEGQSASFRKAGDPYHASQYLQEDVAKFFPGFGFQMGLHLLPKQDRKIKSSGFSGSAIKRKSANKYAFEFFSSMIFIATGQKLSDADWQNFNIQKDQQTSGFVFGKARWVNGVRMSFERYRKVEHRIFSGYFY